MRRAGGLAAVVLAGCGAWPEHGLVEGVVTAGDKPLPDVEVVFIPDGHRGPRAAAYTDAAGRYRVVTDRGTAGAVVGAYRVCFYDIRTNEGAGDPGAKRSRVPPAVTNPERTPFAGVAVRPGPQTLDFDVTRPGR